jgi:methylase of polypeptide subunit release factors
MIHRTRMTSFDGLTIAYDDRVLEPRPWTALQSAWAAELATGSDAPILELYAGVGHIGLSAARRSGRPLVQVEADPVACGFAVENAWRAGMAHCVTVRCEKVPSASYAGQSFSVVIADPPYLPSTELTEFPDDPPSAVDGGADGLAPALACVASLSEALPPATPVLLQLRGATQIDELADRLPSGVEATDVRCIDPERGVVRLQMPGRTAGPAEHATVLAGDGA